MKTTCSWKGCDQPRETKAPYCADHRRAYQRAWRRGQGKNLILKVIAPNDGVSNFLSDEQLTEIWRKADKGVFDKEEVQKMAEDLMTWNAEARNIGAYHKEGMINVNDRDQNQSARNS